MATLYIPEFRKIAKSTQAAILLSYLADRLIKLNTGEALSTFELFVKDSVIAQKLNMTISEIKTARTFLKEAGLFDTKKVGLPPRLCYVFSEERMPEIIKIIDNARNS